MSQSIQEIHRPISDAENLESVEIEQVSIGDVFRSLVRHPLQVIKRWNWKSALLGAILRASFYFGAYQLSKESLIVTMVAVIVEFSFRFFTSGISGAIVQSFRKAKPAWIATLIVSVSLPIFSHTVEFFSHYIQEAYFYDVFPASANNARRVAFATSVIISVVSAVFNIFMMRNGVLLVGAGEETNSLWGDFKRIPLLIYEFTLFLPKQIIQFARNNQIHYAVGTFFLFGLIVGAILGTARGKMSWAYSTALGAWGILLGFIVLVFIVQQIHRVVTKK